uniref:Protein kinase domain-containing protein n=1 Tax=Globisporangium ultimum (strain ATCC 200006 / CBS 805.95 / DAOM BR144) TaxID=431595 RepID=K3WFM7_GLOUD
MIDDIDLTGETPFHIAAQHGHADIVSFLLANRAQVNVLDRAGNTPLIAASRYGCVNVVQVLLELGASVNHVNALGETALIIAAESGQFDVVEELIKANASVHVRSAAGETLLTCAARWSQDDIVNQIIELGCSKLDGIEASEPSLLSATLDKLQQCGGSMDEFEEAWLGVLERLRQVYSLIVQSGGENEQWSILPSFVMILFLLCKQRASPDHKNLITRVCSSRKSMRAIEDLHSRLDRLQRKFASDRASSTWRETSQTNQDIAWKRFHTAINDDTQLLADLNTKADLVEAISLLQYEIVVHGGKYSQESLDLLQRSLDKLLMLSDEEVPDLPQWFVPPHDVDLIICEEGPESKRNNGVTRGKWLGTDIMVVKSRCAREDVLKDVDLWFQMSHPNVLKLYGACHLRSSYMAIIDNVQSTNLREYLAIDENSHLKWQKLFEVGLGIKYLHERECVVGDLRCDRLWVGMDRLAKITPFIGDIICSKPRTASDAANYRPPECLKGKEAFTTASDIFLFGLCILEAVTGNWSWVVEARGVAASSVGWTKLPPRPVEMSLPEWQLIESMCLFDPSKRVKIAYVVEHLKRFVAERREIEAAEVREAVTPPRMEQPSSLQGYAFRDLDLMTIDSTLDHLAQFISKVEALKSL